MSALTPSLLVSLIRVRQRELDPDRRAETTLGVAGPGGLYDVVGVSYAAARNEFYLEIERRDVARPPTGRRKQGP
jgi:hypothetical protein